MIADKTLDQALVEAHRFIKAAKALRAKRKLASERVDGWVATDTVVEHAACKRASLDLTRKLADLRQGR